MKIKKEISALVTGGLMLVTAMMCTGPVRAQVKHSKTTLYPTYKGLVMAGYQGWFRAAGDGTNGKHYAYGDENRSGIDMWPDVTEYAKTYETPFVLANGEKARFLVPMIKALLICISNGCRNMG